MKQSANQTPAAKAFSAAAEAVAELGRLGSKPVKTFPALSMAALLSGCLLTPRQHAQPESLVGRWKESHGTATYEFCADGTVYLTRESRLEARGVYRWLDGGQLKMEFGTPKFVMAGTNHAKVASAQMTLISPQGERSTFHRAD